MPTQRLKSIIFSFYALVWNVNILVMRGARYKRNNLFILFSKKMSQDQQKDYE